MPRNPYWTMYWRPWSRSQGPLAWRLLVPQAVVWLACGLPYYERHHLFSVAAPIWLIWLTARVTWAAAETFERERVQGTLDLAMLVPGSKRRIVYGHWLGSLLSVADLWLMGLPLALLSDDALGAWLFSGAWAAFIAALAVMLSVENTSARRVIFLMPFAAGLMAVVVYCAFIPATVLVSYILGFSLAEHAGLLLSLPPSPIAFTVAFEGGLESLLITLLWWLSTLLVLGLAQVSMTKGIATRGTSHAESGLLPRNVTASSPSGRPPRPNPSFVDLLLYPLRRNPFYRSYREGFMRLFPTEVAAPGSVFPPALTIIIVVAHVAMGGLHPDVLWLLAFPLAISTVEAFGLASRSLSAEREQGTWPLLMASGLAPSRVLSGKLATTFYALSGEWTYTLPVWLLAAAILQSPPFLFFAAITPAAIALATIAGLWMSSRPVHDAEPTRPAEVFAAVFLLAAALGPWEIGAFFRTAARTLIPANAWHAIASAHPTCASVAAIATSALAWTLVAAVAWRSALARLRRVMEGASSGTGLRSPEGHPSSIGFRSAGSA